MYDSRLFIVNANEIDLEKAISKRKNVTNTIMDISDIQTISLLIVPFLNYLYVLL